MTQPDTQQSKTLLATAAIIEPHTGKRVGTRYFYSEAEIEKHEAAADATVVERKGKASPSTAQSLFATIAFGFLCSGVFIAWVGQ